MERSGVYGAGKKGLKESSAEGVGRNNKRKNQGTSRNVRRDKSNRGGSCEIELNPRI